MNFLADIAELTVSQALAQTVLVFVALVGIVCGIFWIINPRGP